MLLFLSRMVIDLAILSVVSSFGDVREWKPRKIAGDLLRLLIPNSFCDDVMQVLSLAPP